MVCPAVAGAAGPRPPAPLAKPQEIPMLDIARDPRWGRTFETFVQESQGYRFLRWLVRALHQALQGAEDEGVGVGDVVEVVRRRPA